MLSAMDTAEIRSESEERWVAAEVAVILKKVVKPPSDDIGAKTQGHT